MDSKISASHLQGVSETLLLALYHRGIESLRRKSIIRDEKALELVASIDYDFSKFGKAHVGVPIRSKLMDEIVLNFLQRYPDATVVNLGAGLDTQFFRVDNGHAIWYDIDLPDSIQLRRRFFDETDRYHMMACSALDFSWMDKVEQHSPIMFVAAGLLPYLPPDNVRRLIDVLSTRFPGSEIVFDTVSEWVSKRSLAGKAKFGSFTQPPMPWGIARNELTNGKYPVPGLEILRNQDLRGHHRWRWGLSGVVSLLPYFRDRLHVSVVHGRFIALLITTVLSNISRMLTEEPPVLLF